MKSIKKLAPILSAIGALVALILFLVAPAIKSSITDSPVSGVKAMTDGKFVIMILFTAILMLIGLIIAFTSSKNQSATLLAALILIIAGVFCFFTKSFYLSANGYANTSLANLIELGAGAIVAGIINIVSAILLAFSKFAK